MLKGQTADIQNINNLRDILTTWNKFAESCFTRCVYNMNARALSEDESKCLDNCSSKFVNANQRMIQTFMEIQQRKQQQMIEDAQKQQAAEMAQQSTMGAALPLVPGQQAPTPSGAPDASLAATDIPVNTQAPNVGESQLTSQSSPDGSVG